MIKKYVYFTASVKDYTQCPELYDNPAGLFEDPEEHNLIVELGTDDRIIKSELKKNDDGEDELTLHVISPLIEG